MKTLWQVEIDEYCRKVLAKHFPEAYQFGDIRECCAIRDNSHHLSCNKPNHLQPVDVISGGFPCQDISEAGKREGIDGERSGLWREYLRIIGELRPGFALVENVAALLNRGIERVVGDLAAIGYDAEWDVVGVDVLGASQHRERVWILAYPKLGSIAVHVEEMLSPKGHHFDRAALQTLLEDVEVQGWISEMDAMAFIPKKR